MTPRQGYYSLIQYCPDASRLEAANLGVVLFCPSLPYLNAKLAPTGDRVTRFFGKDTDASEALEAARSAIADRLIVEKDSFRSVDDFQRFIDTRANDIILAPLRPIRVEVPDEQLDQLLTELVVDPGAEEVIGTNGHVDTKTVAQKEPGATPIAGALRPQTSSSHPRLSTAATIALAALSLGLLVWGLSLARAYRASQDQIDSRIKSQATGLEEAWLSSDPDQARYYVATGLYLKWQEIRARSDAPENITILRNEILRWTERDIPSIKGPDLVFLRNSLRATAEQLEKRAEAVRSGKDEETRMVDDDLALLRQRIMAPSDSQDSAPLDPQKPNGQ